MDTGILQITGIPTENGLLLYGKFLGIVQQTQKDGNLGAKGTL